MIPGTTDRPRLPRIAKIRLGKKVEGRSGKPYPKATEQFNFVDCPEVEEVYGKNCKLLRVQFPTNDIDLFFPTRRAAHRKSGLFCACEDGVTAVRTNVGYCKNKDGSLKPDKNGQPVPLDPQGWEAMQADEDLWDEEKNEPSIGEGMMFQMPCPGEECHFWKRDLCKRNARLFFVLPEVRHDGCYEIATTSFNSIRQILDVVGFIQLRNISVAWLTFDLRLVPAKGKEGATIYVLRLEHPGELPSPRAALPAPVEPERPEVVPDDLVPHAGVTLEAELSGEIAVEDEAIADRRALAAVLGDELGMTTANVQLNIAKAEKKGYLAEQIEDWQAALDERAGIEVVDTGTTQPDPEPPDDSDDLFGPPPAQTAMDKPSGIAAAAVAGQKNQEGKVSRPKHNTYRQRKEAEKKEAAGGGLLDF